MADTTPPFVSIFGGLINSVGGYFIAHEQARAAAKIVQTNAIKQSVIVGESLSIIRDLIILGLVGVGVYGAIRGLGAILP